MHISIVLLVAWHDMTRTHTYSKHNNHILMQNTPFTLSSETRCVRIRWNQMRHSVYNIFLQNRNLYSVCFVHHGIGHAARLVVYERYCAFLVEYMPKNWHSHSMRIGDPVSALLAVFHYRTPWIMHFSQFSKICCAWLSGWRLSTPGHGRVGQTRSELLSFELMHNTMCLLTWHSRHILLRPVTTLQHRDSANVRHRLEYHNGQWTSQTL